MASQCSSDALVTFHPYEVLEMPEGGTQCPRSYCFGVTNYSRSLAGLQREVTFVSKCSLIFERASILGMFPGFAHLFFAWVLYVDEGGIGSLGEWYDRRIPKYQEKTGHNGALTNSNLTWTGVRSNLCRWAESLTPNRPSPWYICHD